MLEVRQAVLDAAAGRQAGALMDTRWKDYESKRRMVLYGPPASGKTTMLATLKGRLWVLDLDRQLKSLLAAWERLKKPKDDLAWVTIDTKSRKTAFEEAKNALFHPPQGYDYYAVDSYTTFGMVATYKTCGTDNWERNYNQQTGTDLMGYVVDYFWQFANKIESWGSWLIVVMHEKWQDVPDGLSDPSDWRSKKQVLAPEVASSARITIPAQCDFVFHVEKARKMMKLGSRAEAVSASVLRTHGTPFIMAKCVGYEDVLEDVEEGDLGAIIDKLKLGPKTKKGR